MAALPQFFLHRDVCLTLLSAQQEDELAISAGEELTILEDRDDGWCVARNSSGLQGIIPANYIEALPTVAPVASPITSPKPTHVSASKPSSVPAAAAPQHVAPAPAIVDEPPPPPPPSEVEGAF